MRESEGRVRYEEKCHTVLLSEAEPNTSSLYVQKSSHQWISSHPFQIPSQRKIQSNHPEMNTEAVSVVSKGAIYTLPQTLVSVSGGRQALSSHQSYWERSYHNMSRLQGLIIDIIREHAG